MGQGECEWHKSRSVTSLQLAFEKISMADEALKHVLALQIWLKKNECALKGSLPLVDETRFQITGSGLIVYLLVCRWSVS